MYVVYVLQDSAGKFYKGMTADLQRRFTEHTQGHTRSTRFLRDLRIVYTEEVADRITARKREKYLKSAAGRRFLKKVLEKGV
jgi:putative endonuclease